jgi:hypothetical protein
VGVLEKLGLPLEYAVNIPSILSFLCLIILIYELGYLVFNRNRFVGYLSVFLFLFNSSLSFVEFFKKYTGFPVKKIVDDWWHLNSYVTVGPWDGNIILIFWNLNVYINQRHIAFGTAALLIVLILLICSKSIKTLHFNRVQYIVIGFITGLLVLWHGMAFLCLFGITGLFFLLYSERKELLITLITAFIVALPQILFLQQGQAGVNGIALISGFHINSFLIGSEYLSSPFWNNTLDYILSFIRFWFYNIGFSLILIPASFFLLDRKNKKIFLIILSLFILGNVVKLGIDINGNHKVFNFWLIVSNVFTSYLIYRLFKLNLISKVISILLILLTTASGFIDIMPIKNSFEYNYTDVQKDPLGTWVLENTNPDDIFLTTYRFYNPIALAGRRTMQSFPVYAWTQGHDVDSRKNLAKMIYRPKSASNLCDLLKENNIHYVQTEKEFEKDPVFNIDHDFYADQFDPVYDNPRSHLKEKVYSRDEICSKVN